MMKTMRLIDADKLKKSIILKDYSDKSLAYELYKWIDAQEFIDVVDVVHCKDCIHWSGPDDGMVHRCYLDALCRPGEWFCAGGARKKGSK